MGLSPAFAVHTVLGPAGCSASGSRLLSAVWALLWASALWLLTGTRDAFLQLWPRLPRPRLLVRSRAGFGSSLAHVNTFINSCRIPHTAPIALCPDLHLISSCLGCSCWVAGTPACPRGGSAPTGQAPALFWVSRVGLQTRDTSGGYAGRPPTPGQPVWVRDAHPPDTLPTDSLQRHRHI